jgi:hypothetical protein
MWFVIRHSSGYLIAATMVLARYVNSVEQFIRLQGDIWSSGFSKMASTSPAQKKTSAAAREPRELLYPTKCNKDREMDHAADGVVNGS